VISDLGGRPVETGAEAYVPAVPPDGLVDWCRKFAAGEQDQARLRERALAFRSEYRMDRLNAETVRTSLTL
jgi:hypothetical protein